MTKNHQILIIVAIDVRGNPGIGIIAGLFSGQRLIVTVEGQLAINFIAGRIFFITFITIIIIVIVRVGRDNDFLGIGTFIAGLVISRQGNVLRVGKIRKGQ